MHARRSVQDRTAPTYDPLHPRFGPRPAEDDDTADTSVWSSLTLNGQRLAWHEAAAFYEHEAEVYRGRANAWGTLVRDLTRCEHGRCAGDVCSGAHPHGCDNGPSRGNPVVAFLSTAMRTEATGYTERDQDEVVERLAYAAEQGRLVPGQIGFGLYGRPIVIPERGRVHDPDAWRAPVEATEGV